MAARVCEVPVRRTVELDLYRNVDHLEPRIEHANRLGREVAELLGAAHVWMVNSTASGGGVAEMLPRLCSLLADAGVDTRWLVLEPDRADFFAVTKSLHNMLHGEAGAVPLDEGASAAYDAVSRAGAEAVRAHLGPGDVLIVHDPQPAGLLRYLKPDHLGCSVWRCHIGVPYTNEWTERGWAFLDPYLDAYQRFVFSLPSYVPERLHDQARVICPGIDPLSHKNRTLRPYKLNGVLRAAGLAEGPAVGRWARFAAQAQRYVGGGRWESTPIADLLHRPIVLQVSRFDRLKGFHLLIPAFERMLAVYPEAVKHLRVDTDRAMAELGDSILCLAGPDPAAVADDPEGAEVLGELCAQFDGLPGEVAARVHLLRLPMKDAKQNALIVNALQRQASVVVQCSVREGFGLTVAEALWKGTPMVASNVGGISHQIRPETDGLLVEDPEDADALAQAILTLLGRPLQADILAQSGRRRVTEHFLVVTQVCRWLEVLRELLENPCPE